jgi:hypothetical protein
MSQGDIVPIRFVIARDTAQSPPRAEQLDRVPGRAAELFKIWVFGLDLFRGWVVSK